MDSDDEFLHSGTQYTTTDIVNEYTWLALAVDAPDWYICPIYKTVFPDPPSFQAACTAVSISSAICLDEVLRADTPPTNEFFYTLPLPPSKNLWGIYVRVYEKPNHKPRLYIGSGTAAVGGVQRRLQDYINGKRTIPSLVKLAVEDGYTCSHVGLLCWAPIPPPELVPKARVRFVAMEAMFCQIFFALAETVVDISYWVPWKRADVVWEPLCSHTPLIECPPGNHDLSDTQLIQYNLERQRIAKQRVYESGKKYEANQQKTNRVDYLARKLRNKIASMKRNPERERKNQAGVRARAKASAKHRCNVCDINLQSANALKIHRTRKGHLEKVRVAAGGVPKPVSAETQRTRNFYAANMASGRFRCAVCGENLQSKGHLDVHNKSKKHLAKVAALEKAATAA